MNVARILYPVKVLGPGLRVGIWLCGCNRRCRGCSNPELWEQKPEYEISISKIIELVSKIADKNEIDGFTISGGEPMDQTEELSELIERIRQYSSDILIYTGYTLEQLRERRDDRTEKITSRIAVLIDGEYKEEENVNAVIRGSSNQKIHILNTEFEETYKTYLDTAHNQIQNFTTSDGIVSVGIHRKGFSK